MEDPYYFLQEESRNLQKEILECMKYLNSLHVPTNGLDSEGNLGYGKRENLTLLQRIKFMKYEKS
jgi:hypothetical protein